jgi:hypothetical protein
VETVLVNELGCLEVAETHVVPVGTNAIEVRSWASWVCHKIREEDLLPTIAAETARQLAAEAMDKAPKTLRCYCCKR